MKLDFDCPHCKQPLVCGPERAGKKVDCPHCQKPINVPELANVRRVVNRFRDAPGLEGSLHNFSLALNFLCVICAGGLAIFCIHNETLVFIPAIVGLLLLAIVQHYFFAWASEALAVLKKIAGLPYNPTLALYQHEYAYQCSWCNEPIPENTTACPRCKRILKWPEAKPPEPPQSLPAS
jgi:hypothetical protein